MKALCWHGKGDVRCEEVPDPRIEQPRVVADHPVVLGPLTGQQVRASRATHRVIADHVGEADARLEEQAADRGKSLPHPVVDLPEVVEQQDDDVRPFHARGQDARAGRR